MAIFQLTSNNPEFSQVIRKHPKGGMRSSSIKLGNAFGWYSQKNQAYNLYFRDAENEVSFKTSEEESFEYLNVSRYNSPLFYNHALKEFFASATKSKQEKDDSGFKNGCTLNLIRLKRPNLVERVKDYFKGYEIKIIPHEGLNKDFTIHIQTKQSLYELLNFVDLLCLFIAALNKEWFYTDASLLKKYLSALNLVDAPYFFRYVFKLHLLWRKKDFKQFKSLLEKSESQSIQMSFGTNLQARKRFVDGHIDLEKPIFDVGCGEGYYTLNYAKHTEQKIHAVDIDEEVLEILQKKAEKKKLENIVLYSSAEELPEDMKPQIILTEVIEHMSLKEAEQLLNVVASKQPEKIILTTPNQEFNQFYFEDEEEMRHHDHDFEISEKDFEKWIKKSIKTLQSKHKMIQKITPQFKPVGDVVNDHPTTLGCVLNFEYE